MMFYKFAILTAVAGLVQCKIIEDISGVDEFKKVLTVVTNSTVKDAKDKPVTQTNTMLAVYGEYDQEEDQDVLKGFVAEKLSLLERKPVESLQEIYVDQNSLPLLLNETIVELITTGPKPVKKIYVIFKLDLFAKKKTHQEALFAIKALKSF